MKPWRFIHVTDIHIGSPRSFRYQPAWNENWETARGQIIDQSPELVLVGGDVTRDGQLHDFECAAVKADFDRMPCPVHVIPGNMDTGNKHTRTPGNWAKTDDIAMNLTASQITHFERFFGPSRWSFVHKGTRFTGFYGAIAGSGIPQEQAMWEWLERLPQLPAQEHHVVMMHYPLFIDNPDEDNFDLTDPKHYHDWYFGINQPYRGRMIETFQAAHVDIVLSGHVHCRKTDVFNGITYYKGASTAFPQWDERWPDGDPTLGFYCFNVTTDGITPTFVPLRERSEAVGYGPGGHPTPEDRDYSLAWEQDGSG